VPTDPAVLKELEQRMGQAPYLVRGQPVGAYTLQVRQDCQGPVQDVSGARPGTVFYCVAPGRSQGWLSAVGLPPGERFGSPAVLSAQGGPFSLQVTPRPPADDEGELEAARLLELELGLAGLDGGVAGGEEAP
jgi:hypothetical protein